ncbi:MAG TPA: CoA transferase, partial [Phenylobacterium sp.]|nr:CoA transferase [Phenylobacterium sp.]
AGINLLGPILLDVSVNNRSTRDGTYPTGNRLEHPNAAPHGVYPCVGEDRWIAIAVFNDAEWQGLVSVMGGPAWASEARFATQAARCANQDALDALVGAWTAGQDRHQLMHRLQAAGVRAGAVQTAEDTNDHDPQIASRGVFFEMDHPVIGEARFEGTPIQFSETVQENWRSGPLLGEDNAHVFKGLVGVSEDDYEDLAAEGVI